MPFEHLSVLLSECMDGLAIKPDGIYVDGTAGGGGHSFHIAERLTTGRLIALDKDPDAIAASFPVPQWYRATLPTLPRYWMTWV